MILQELWLSRTREMSKLAMVAIITKGNILFGIPSTFSLSRNSMIGFIRSCIKVPYEGEKNTRKGLNCAFDGFQSDSEHLFQSLTQKTWFTSESPYQIMNHNLT